MNAADPSSPSGWNIEGLDRRLPARTGRSRLCFRGGELAAVSGRGEKELSVFPPPEDPALPELLSFMTLSRRRDCHRAGKVVVERINGRPAGESPYGAALKALGFSADRDKLVLW
jgi:hypothetical protein